MFFARAIGDRSAPEWCCRETAATLVVTRSSGTRTVTVAGSAISRVSAAGDINVAIYVGIAKVTGITINTRISNVLGVCAGCWIGLTVTGAARAACRCAPACRAVR